MILHCYHFVSSSLNFTGKVGKHVCHFHYFLYATMKIVNKMKTEGTFYNYSERDMTKPNTLNY